LEVEPMQWKSSSVLALALTIGWFGGGERAALAVDGSLEPQAQAPAPAQAAAPAVDAELVRTLVSRLTLANYKATIKGLTAFGDRREGTQRNRDAVDWIEKQLQSVGCTTSERVMYDPPAPRGQGGGRRGGGAGQAAGQAGGQRGGQQAAQAGQAGRGGQQQAQAGQAAQGQRGGQAGRGGGRGAADQDLTTSTGGLVGRRGGGSGGSTIFGHRARTGVNNNREAQEDEALRELNAGPVINAPIPLVYCTKIGTTRPGEMYIVGAHMDGIGWGQAANDDGSGTAIVMELARIFNAPDVTTDVSIRFALWNGEEGGLRGARAYVAQRQALQGQENPAGSGRYPEPKWLGMVQHDMMMWDHGMPRPDGTVSRDQRPEADVNIEFQSNSQLAEDSMKFAFFFKAANDAYATDYPAAVGPHMTNTDSTPFMDIVPAISLRENERGAQIGAGWDPNWHQVTDVYTTYTDNDFRLGLNAGQTTLAAIAQLVGAKITGR
jgi:hypothetical protein